MTAADVRQQALDAGRLKSVEYRRNVGIDGNSRVDYLNGWESAIDYFELAGLIRETDNAEDDSSLESAAEDYRDETGWNLAEGRAVQEAFIAGAQWARSSGVADTAVRGEADNSDVAIAQEISDAFPQSNSMDEHYEAAIQDVINWLRARPHVVRGVEEDTDTNDDELFDIHLTEPQRAEASAMFRTSRPPDKRDTDTNDEADETNQAVNAWIGYARSESLVWDMPNSSESRAFLAGRDSVRSGVGVEERNKE